MKANRAYRLLVHRGSREPAFLADPARLDRVELVAVEDSEVILLWDLPPREASRLLRALKADLATMDAEEFILAWQGADAVPGE